MGEISKVGSWPKADDIYEERLSSVIIENNVFFRPLADVEGRFIRKQSKLFVKPKQGIIYVGRVYICVRSYAF